MWSILIHKFHISKIISLKFISDPQNQCSRHFHSPSWTCPEHQINLRYPTWMLSTETKTGPLFCLQFQLSYYGVLFTVCAVSWFFTFLCCLLLILQFHVAPKQSVKVLSSVPTYKKAVMCLQRKHTG